MSKYQKEDPEFAKVCEEFPEFAPRMRVFLTSREAEQDAYFWFQQGIRSELSKAIKAVREGKVSNEKTNHRS